MAKIITIIAVIALLGAGAFALGNKGDVNTDEEKVENTDVNDQSMESNSEFSGSLKELVLSGDDVTCTFSRVDENGEIEGVVFIDAKGERVRGDFNIKQSGDIEFETHIINDSEFGYTWGKTPFGEIATKFKINESDKTASDKSQPFNQDEKMDYQCSKWKVDESKFDLPDGVQFQDISVQVEQATGASASVKSSQCGACNQIPDASAKAQCLAALGC